ncbi:MAG: 4Fe-4S binding protein [Proteobacteria bacterium]|nr:4Fe-4S binding protein [Pseudomonadota bacterium]
MKILFSSKKFETEMMDPEKCDPDELVMMIDVDRCISCGSCEIACQLEHRKGAETSGPFRPIAIGFEKPENERCVVCLPLSCRHCESPCEYYSPYNFWINCPETEKKSKKTLSCDFCIDRTKKGLWPACATRCTMKTIYFGYARYIAFVLGEKRLREMGDVCFSD